MKHLLITATAVCALCATSGPHIFAASPKPLTIRVDEPGTLQKLLPVSKLNKKRPLVLSGRLDNDDIIWLRYICGRDTVNASTRQYVSGLDMSQVSFVPQGSPYFVRLKSTYGITDSSTLPAALFYEVPVKSVVLPQTIDSIAPFSLMKTALTDIYIPDGVKVANNTIAYNPDLVSLRLPAQSTALQVAAMQLPSLKSVRYGDVNYVPSGAFRNMENLEEVVFDGMVGHIDGYQFNDNPELKRIIFNGPVYSTGGPVLASDCASLTDVEFNGLCISMGLVEYPGCPSFTKPVVNGTVIDSSNPSVIKETAIADIVPDESLCAQYLQLAKWQTQRMTEKGFLKNMALAGHEEMEQLGHRLGCDDMADAIASDYQTYRNPDEGKTKLQVLKESAPYKAYDGSEIKFTYAQPCDSMLTAVRLHYNLDSIAGNGSDYSRIKNLTYWIHDLVRHDGSSPWPTCPLDIRSIAKVCKDEERGVNCRMMAIMLTEALLAEGIPARYLTCLPKAYDDDNDCHVICMAWAADLGRWVWADPTFAAFATDGDGNPLHPGEVRYRLQNDLDVAINNDANWNHRQNIDKDSYLGNYMAKNLYLMECITDQVAVPEGSAARRRGTYVTLAPDGFQYPNTTILMSDPDILWQAPAN